MKRRTRFLVIGLTTLLALIGGGLFYVRSLLLGSLPLLEGEIEVPGLSAPVTVHRDDLGVPVIEGENQNDVLRGLGFVHAQERFFQMDLARRRSAGEIAELVGVAALASDLSMRPLGMRKRARAVYSEAPAHHREALRAYAEGVNSGIFALKAAPPEYLALRTDPEPWLAEDSVLVIFAMFDLLSQDSFFEMGLSIMQASLPPELFRFLTPDSGVFDAPLVGPVDGGAARPSIPGPEVVDLRLRPAGNKEREPEKDQEVPEDRDTPGSNNFAVAGSRSTHGGAMVANDMHLPLTVPGIWYRVQLSFEGRRIAGVSLAGIPSVVAGSNGDVAWGFTNVCGDFQDWVVVEVDPENENRYRVEDGWEEFTKVTESISIRNEEAQDHVFQKTRWGIVTETDHLGRPLVLKWTALEPGGVNFSLVDLLTVSSLEEGADVVRGWKGPPQNVLLADKTGRIGWVLAGYLPRRMGMDGRVSVSWADRGVGWEGELDPSLRPEVIDPEEGILFTANNRTLPISRSRLLGRAWSLGARAGRIAERLREKEKFSEEDLLAIQLDVRSRVHDFYRDLLLKCVGEERDAWLQEMVTVVKTWDGTAGVDQAGFRLLRELRRRLHRRLLAPLVEMCPDLPISFIYQWPMIENPVREILTSQPPHFLPPDIKNYQTLVRDVARGLMKDLKERPEELSTNAGWGRANQTQIVHGFSSLVPQLAGWLDMESTGLPGDVYCVRVQGPAFGASERFVVSPGKEEQGILHMPCGQSGHFLSDHYSDSHEAWVKGLPTRFLSGDPRKKLRLIP